MTLRFEGYSDDTFGEYNETQMDHDNCANGQPIQFEVVMPDGSGVRVTGCYDTHAHGATLGDGCWMIGVEALDDEKPVDWSIRLMPSAGGYRGALEIDAPDDAVVVDATK